MTKSHPKALYDHYSIIERMNSTHHHTGNSGVCNGVAHEGMLAILSETLDSFDQTIHMIGTTKLSDFTEAANDFKNKTGRRMAALLDGIALFQNPDDHKDIVTNKKAYLTQYNALRYFIPLLVTPELEKTGGVAMIRTASGSGTRESLNAYFNKFAEIVNRTGLHKPIAFVLNNADHAVTLGYLPARKKWVMIDANNLPSEYVDAGASCEIGSLVMSRLLYSDKTAVFTLQAYVQGSTRLEYKKCMKKWVKCKESKAVHIPTEKTCHAKNSNNTSWLFVATNNDQFDLSARLIKNGADVNEARGDKHKITPLINAASDGYLNIVKLLLDNGANIDQVDSDGTTALFMAAQSGHLDMVKYLLEHDADCSLPSTQSEEKFIKFARKKSKDTEERMLQFLDRHRESAVDKDRSSFTSFLKNSLFNLSNLKIRKAYTWNNYYKMTPLQMAEIMGHKEIVDILRKHTAAIRCDRRGQGT